MEKANFKPRD